jgi:transcription elongation GreA/GreB family factor
MTDQDKIDRKIRLKTRALAILHERIEHALKAMNEAQRSANAEDKSSVGDKYQTGRAMAQNDRDIYARQLDQAQKEQAFAQQTDVSLFSGKVEPGAYMETETEKYFFLTGLGVVETDAGNVFFLSVSSPLGQALRDMRVGDRVVFNKKEMVIKELY